MFWQGEETNQSEVEKSGTVLLVNYRKDGTRFWNELSRSPIYDDEGNLTHYISIQNDITDRQIAAAQGDHLADLMLNKIISELIENALKFSEEETPVRIITRCKNNQFILEMINQGRGMTPEQIAKLGAYMQFERRLYEQQGTGLGLSIVKRIAELHEN